jgi:hypothetical protein
MQGERYKEMMKYAECSGNIINLCTKMEKNET